MPSSTKPGDSTGSIDSITAPSAAGPAVELRPAAVGDCAAMRDIYNHYVLHETCTWALEPETLEQRTTWFERHGPDHPVLMAEVAGRPVGWGSLSAYNPRGGYRATVEDSLYLDPAWRGRGVGSALLARLIELAVERGHRTIIAGISAEQSGSRALHARHGFVDAGRLNQAGFKHGRWLDVIYMQLLLPPGS
jgi:L-amino acid N-acyltransferase YncA